MIMDYCLNFKQAGGHGGEITYGEVRLQPLMFQDDVVRLAGDMASAVVDPNG